MSSEPAELVDDATTTRILDAALSSFAAVGIAKTSMAYIARRAGVDRATVYRRIGTVENVVDAAFALDGLRLVAALQEEIRGLDGRADRIERAFTLTVRHMRDHPILLKALDVDRPAALVSAAAITPRMMAAAADVAVEALLRDRDDTVGNRARARAAAELLVRLIHSLVLFPDAPPVLRTDDDLAGYARTVVAPAVTGLMEGPI